MDDQQLRMAFDNAAATAGEELGMAPAPEPIDFCVIWPKAKPILTAIATVIVFLPIPGVSTGAGAVLRGLIGVGDEMQKTLCKT